MPPAPRLAPLLRLLLLSGLGLVSLAASAADFRVNLGAATLRGGTATVGARAVFPGVLPNDLVVEVGAQLFDSSRYRSFAQPGQAMVTSQLVKDFRFIEAGFGVAYVARDDIYNSGRLNFITAARFHLSSRLDIEWNHVSNAGLRKPNRGRDMALLSYKF
jgi:hypothetical protein